jgi:hypothetical protein
MKHKGYLLLPLLLWAGCGRSTPPPNAPARSAQAGEGGAGVKETLTSGGEDGGASTDYLPMEVGRTMVYDVTWSLPGLKPGEATATGTMVGRVEVGGEAYFKQTTTVSGIPYNLTKTALFRRTPQGVCQIWEGEEDSAAWLYLPAGVKSGDEWTSTSPSGEYQFRAEGLEDVETPSGTYRDCLKLSRTIKATLTGGSEEQWLAPGVGVVKQVDRNRFFSSTTLLKEVR